MSFGTALGDRTGRCNCPLDAGRDAVPARRQLHQEPGHPHREVRRRRPAGLQPARAERQPPLRRDRLQRGAHAGTDGRRHGPRDLPAGRRLGYRRYVSIAARTPASGSGAGSYYAQDTWRADHEAGPLNYGLRARGHHARRRSTRRATPGFFDLETGEMKVAGVGGVGLDGDIKNKINLAPRLGITYQFNAKTVMRLGYGRSYDIGVFGSTFGHSVTQNLPVLARQTLNAPAELRAHLHTWPRGPPPPTLPRRSDRNGRFEAPDGVNPSILPDQQRLPSRGRLEPDRPARAVARASRPRSATWATRARTSSTATVPTSTSTSRSWQGFAERCPRNTRRPFFAGPGGRLRRSASA
mgnify:CR=1 FL=1